MKKWEYRVMSFLALTGNDVETGLNNFGREGWEIIKYDSSSKVITDELYTNVSIVAKRPVEEKKQVIL
jgi:hypothetical protein